MKVALIMPTYGRAHILDQRTENATSESPGADVYWIIEDDDVESKGTLELIEARYLVNARSRNYAGAINTGVLALYDQYDAFFCGADDLRFHPNWLPPVLEKLQHFAVVGTNDLLNGFVLAGTHATHYMVRKDYALNACIDCPGQMMFEGYHHNWTDTELVGTARFRGVFTPCLESVVEHIHWVAGKAPIDPTYQKGEATMMIDKPLYLQRAPMWNNLNVP